MSNIVNKLSKNKENIIMFLLFVALGFIFLIQSPMHPFINGETGQDSSVFRLIGTLMNKGYMPYKDTFDHKGPLLYILNYIGFVVSFKYGVWFVELIFISITFFVMYKIARLFTRKTTSVCSVLLSSSLLYVFFDGGNLVEEYAMMFIAISLYIFIDYYVNDNITIFRLILCGFSFGAVLMLRPNMVVTWAVMSIGILIKLIKEKNYKLIFKFLLWFLIGTLIITIPILVWLYVNNSLNAFYQDYILFNLKYSAVRKPNIINVLINNYFVLKNWLLTLSIVVLFMLALTKKRKLYITYLLCIIFNLVVTTYISVPYPHYFMIFIPIIVFPVTLFIDYLVNLKAHKYAMIFIVLICFAFGADKWFVSTITTIRDESTSLKTNNSKNNYLYDINAIVSSKTNLNDKILVYGNNDYIYLYCDRMPASKFSYQLPITIDKNLQIEYEKDLLEEKPKVIIVQKAYQDKLIDTFIKSNNYHNIGIGSNDYEVFVK